MKISKINTAIKGAFMLVVGYLTAILFLSGIIVLNVAVYLEFELFHGLIATGVSLMFVGWLMNYESEKYERR